MYEHHGRPFPAPERVIDTTLALQRPDGKWRDDESRPPLSYLELDALYTDTCASSSRATA